VIGFERAGAGGSRSAANPSFGYPLRRNLAAPGDGCVGQYVAKGRANTWMEELVLDGQAVEFAVHVKRPPRGGWGEVGDRTLLTLLLPYPKRSPWPGQPTAWIRS
jgi:hypothetical protein